MMEEQILVPFGRKDDKKITLVTMKETYLPISRSGKGISLLTLMPFMEEVIETVMAFVVVERNGRVGLEVSKEVQPLIE